MRLAFGTFRGLADPLSFMGDAGYVHHRWRANPAAAFAAEVNGELAGSNFAARWGSVGFVGPLTIHPDLWNRGIGKRLLEPVMQCFATWGTSHAGLFTFAQSQKHVGLYQKFGFWPRFLTAIMSRPVAAAAPALRWTAFSQLLDGERDAVLGECRGLADRIHAGLDLGAEIAAVAAQALGDTVLLRDDAGLAGFAVCHLGPGTEAGSGTCYVKFGAARPGPAARERFRDLLEACSALARSEGATRVVAGVNTAREAAYREMLDAGFRTDIQGVSMARPNEPGYNRTDVFAVDDWR